ncbi:MAG: deoxyribose-phosphate aldolase [Eubacteriales bacterium]|nr:deoxyribose-phosphate aldolase [Eubacteriales bacterium]
MTSEQLAKYFDHTLLKAAATREDFDAFCAQCRQFGFMMAAVNPAAVPLCKQLLTGSGVRTGAAVGFPLGQNTIQTKVFETRQAIEQGADEIDYVVNIMQLKAKNYDYVTDEMAAIVQACREKQVVSKVIFETCYLTRDEKLALCAIARDVGPDYVKTSTGFGTGGATYDDIALMKQAVGDGIKIKASGGVRTLEEALRYIELGVSRIGSTASVGIVEAYRARQ